VNAYPQIRNAQLCRAITAARVAAALRGGSTSTVDVDTSRFPRLTARIRQTQTLYGWAHITCGRAVFSARVMPGANGPVIRVYAPP